MSDTPDVVPYPKPDYLVSASSRAAEIRKLLPNADPKLQLEVLERGFNNESALKQYVQVLESPRLKLPSASTLLRKLWPVIVAIGILAASWMALRGLGSIIRGLPSLLPVDRVSLPSDVQPIHTALIGEPRTGAEAAHLFAAMSVVQLDRDGLTVGDLKTWLAAIGPKFKAVNPRLKVVGLDQPLLEAVKAHCGAESLYSSTAIPEPAQFFASVATAAEAAVNDSRITWE